MESKKLVSNSQQPEIRLKCQVVSHLHSCAIRSCRGIMQVQVLRRSLPTPNSSASKTPASTHSSPTTKIGKAAKRTAIAGPHKEKTASLPLPTIKYSVSGPSPWSSSLLSKRSNYTKRGSRTRPGSTKMIYGLAKTSRSSRRRRAMTSKGRTRMRIWKIAIIREITRSNQATNSLKAREYIWRSHFPLVKKVLTKRTRHSK